MAVESIDEQDYLTQFSFLLDPSHWEEVVRGNLPGFSGNARRAGKLMGAFCEGVFWMAEKLAERDSDVEIPVIAIANLNLPNPAEVAIHTSGYIVEDDLIFVNAMELEMASSRDINKRIFRYEPSGQLVHHGSDRDLYRLTGVEEMHHAHTVHRGLDPDSPMLKSEVIKGTLAIHDAREAEFQSLLSRIQFAKDVSMPKVTIDHLVRRETAARKLRNKDRIVPIITSAPKFQPLGVNP